MKAIGPTKSIANPVLIGCVILVLVLYYLIDTITVGMTSQEKTVQKQLKQYYHLAECQALMNHDRGHWEHEHSNELLNDTSSFMNKTYLPIEVEWMRGKEYPISPTWGCQGEIGLMYVSQIGHQCGYQMQSFHTSLSKWVSTGNNTSSKSAHRGPNENITSPSLQLILQLAETNSSLCFAGDSIDLQFYEALRNNLQRQKQLQYKVNISLVATSIPANYTNATGVPMYTGWMTMSYIQQTTVSITYYSLDDGQERHSTTNFRYFQMYGWSPWVTPFMEDCDIAIFNIGLHYGAHDDMRSTHYGGNRFSDDMNAVITHMTDFASSGDHRIAVWRSVLPQHFNTVDGHWTTEGTNCSLKTWKGDEEQEIQLYNTAAKYVFSTNCVTMDRDPPYCSHRHEYNCTVDRTSLEYRTVYKYFLDNNFTEHLERFKQPSTITGRVLQWNIADLFDVPHWHASDGDCSHFCYVVPLYEAAFERLGLLLPMSS
jgi:hypothetical protein